MVRKLRGAEVVRITGARQGLAEDVRGRQRRYIISMSVRTVAVVLAAVLWNVQRPVAVVALALGVLLPYVAVVIANGGRENVKSLPSTFVPAPVRPALEAPLEGRVMDPDEDPFRASEKAAEGASGTAGAVNDPPGRTT